MKKILVVMEVKEEHKKMLSELGSDYEIRYVHFKEATLSDAQWADAIVGNINPKFLKDCPDLKLMQTNSAGLDAYMVPGVIPAGCTLKSASGAYGLSLSEYMVAELLMLIKHSHKYYELQLEKRWGDLGEVKSIWNSKTLVVGLGDIGGEFAKRMAALGSEVYGIKRSIPDVLFDYVQKIIPMSEVKTLLSDMDFVASSIPGSKDTEKIYNKDFFDAMKEGSYFINVGRGISVDQDALCDALNSGHLAGAILDVTVPEPLPADNKLWNAKNIIITPHIAGSYHLPETRNRIIRIAIKNIKEIV